jgi:hypothetical protein
VKFVEAKWNEDCHALGVVEKREVFLHRYTDSDLHRNSFQDNVSILNITELYSSRA